MEAERESLHLLEHPVPQIGLGAVRESKAEVTADADPDPLQCSETEKTSDGRSQDGVAFANGMETTIAIQMRAPVIASATSRR